MGAVAVPMAAATSAHALDRGFYGLSAFDTPTEADFNRIGAAGAGTFRMTASWETIQPVQNGPFLFASYDPAVEQAARSGLEIVFLLYGTPSYLSPRVSEPPLRNADQKQQWSRFVSALVQRYGHGGSFWTEHPDVPPMPVHSYVVWNEVNLKVFWYPKPKPRRYVELAALTRAAVRSADPRGRIVTAGLFRLPADGTGISANAYLSKLYGVRGFKAAVDAVALHMFAPSARRVLGAIEAVRQVMIDHRDRGTPIWINELAWATGGSGGDVFQASEKGQARKLSQTVNRLLRERRRFKLHRILWLAYRDAEGPPDTWIQHMGLLRSNRQPKPAWFTFAKLAGGTP